tara:strand:+ start:408 stop:1232 length:825 start_codon:yes stop_codon:yes gene_type:complete
MSKGTISPDGKWLWTGTEWIPAPPTSPPVMPPPPPSTPVAPAEPESGYFSANSEIEVGNYFSNISSIEEQLRQNIQNIGENCYREATCGKTGRPVDGKWAKWTLESVEEIDGLYWIVASSKNTQVSHLDSRARFVLSGTTYDDLIEGHAWDDGRWTPHFSTGKRDRMVFDPFGQNPPKSVASVAPVAGGFVDSDFERDIRRNIQQVGLASFPDDDNTTWNILSIREENGLHWVETKPIPHVGYEKIMFVMNSPSPGGVAECHYWENGSWGILFS